MDDQRALERYRYLLRTAPPETLEQAHAEAFAQLTPEQRRLVLQRMAESVPASERPLVEQAGGNPNALARLATRQEMRQPGTMERMFGQAGGMSLGGLMAGTLLSSIAGTVLGSMIAQQFLGGAEHDAADPGQEDWGASDADAGMAEGGDLDVGGGFDV